MSELRHHLTSSLRAGARIALLALVVSIATGVGAFVLSAAPVTEALASAPPAELDRLSASPTLVAPTPNVTAEPTEEAVITTIVSAAIVAAPVETPRATPAPVASSALTAMSADHGTIIAAIEAVWPAELVPTVVRIASCESTMNTAARNRWSGAAGLFQALGHGPVPADALGQAQQALAIYEEAGGFGPWSSSAYCWR